MCNFRKGNYLWNKNNHTIVCCDSTNKNVFSNGVQVAFPILLNEEVLEILGFKTNNNCGYEDCNGHIIELFGTSLSRNVLKYKNVEIKYIHELQDVFEDNGGELNVNETSLANYLKKTIHDED